MHEKIGKSGTWGYFDGPNKGTPSMCRERVAIFFSGAHFTNFNVGLGRGSNNYVEPPTMNLLMKTIAKKGVARF
jgi:hypothetical protein